MCNEELTYFNLTSRKTDFGSLLLASRSNRLTRSLGLIYIHACMPAVQSSCKRRDPSRVSNIYITIIFAVVRLMQSRPKPRYAQPPILTFLNAFPIFRSTDSKPSMQSPRNLSFSLLAQKSCTRSYLRNPYPGISRLGTMCFGARPLATAL